jgi:paired amphipathic helix protein Sin3a
VIYKALIHKKIDNASFYEELCRDILGNESYFLFNMDKLVNSLIKSLSSICNDNITRECINLYLCEKNRKKVLNESLYFSNFIQLIDIYNMSSFRILYCPDDRIMTIHAIDTQLEQNRKEYLESFKEFIDSVMQESYNKLIKENLSQDEPFNIYLKRNIEMMKMRKKPKILENNLQFKVNN